MHITVDYHLPKDQYYFDLFTKSELMYELIKDIRNITKTHYENNTNLTDIDVEDLYQRASDILGEIGPDSV